MRASSNELKTDKKFVMTNDGEAYASPGDCANLVSSVKGLSSNVNEFCFCFTLGIGHEEI